MHLRITVILIALFFSPFLSFGQRFNFRQFSVEEGLSQSQVLDVSQDAYGNMWFATYGGGITVYNGADVRYYTTNDGLPSYMVLSLWYASDSVMWVGTTKGFVIFKDGRIIDIDPDNKIHTSVLKIREGKDKTIWLATQQGLWKYTGGKLSKIKEKRLENSTVFSLCFDQEQKLWFATSDNGVVVYDGELFAYNVLPEIKPFLVEDISQDHEGTIWFATTYGVYFYKDNRLKQFTKDLKSPNSHFYAVYKDPNNNLWLGYESKGLTIIRENETLYLNKNQNRGFLTIYRIFADQSGDIWIATDGGGVSIFNGFLFAHYDFSDISNNFIMKVHIDDKDNKWMGTDGDGIIFMNESRRFLITEKDGLAGNLINSIARDMNQNIWFATDNGLTRYDGYGFNNFTKRNGLVSDSIISLLVDQEGKLWCGTSWSGISIYDGKRFQPFAQEEFQNEEIWRIFQARDGKIYFGAVAGLRVFDGNELMTYTEQDGMNRSEVWCIAEDPKGVIWMANEELMSFDGEKFVVHQDVKQQQAHVIYILEFDDQGNMIIGTEKGLDHVSFDQEGNIEHIKHYGKSDGFMGIECNENAITKNDKGHLLIGTINGLTIFKPEEVFTDTIEPQTNITNIKLFYEEIDWLAYADSLTPEYQLPVNLRLPYNKNTLSFEFIAINYNIPEKVRYQYKLEGFDDQWQPVTAKNEVSFTNIPHGKYTFMVKACNHDGIWNKEPTRFSFEIAAPFYLKWWFIVAAIAMLALLVYAYVFINTLRLKRLHAMLTQKVTERTRLLNQQKNELVAALKVNKEQNEKLEMAYEKVKESSRLKEIFLANTSHEIRTPLNVIIGFTNLLLKTRLERKQLTYLNNIRISGDNLLVVLNDILDFSKIEANKLTLEITDFKIDKVVNDCFKAASMKAKEKKLDYSVQVDDDVPEYVQGDPVRLSQILTNLIRNAIKFTDDKGKVSVKVDYLDEKGQTVYILFRVIDTGIGISEEHQKKIFDSFTQAKSDMTRKYGGTGLGLSIVKKLIDMHNGEITLRSKQGKGSTFSFTIGYKKSNISKVIENKQREKEKIAKPEFESNILLVEDNELNVNLAVDTITSFNDKINIDVAENGKIGCDLALKNEYDLIIMDIQMPVMDGYEATACIRNQFPAAKRNIPILGMTAHAMKEEKEKCFELGMDDYLTKPFVPEELFSKITNLVSKIQNKQDQKQEPAKKENSGELTFEFVDLEVLNKTYKGNKTKIAKIVEICLNNIPGQIAELDKHYKEENWKNLRVIAHSLKTSLNYLGMKGLREAALRIEKNAADQVNLDSVPSLVETIKEGWNNAQTELNNVLNKLKN